MKEWCTAAELAALSLPGFPASESAVLRLAEREGWNDHPAFAREREGRGGGMEYDYRLLPTLAQVAYVQAHMTVAASDAAEASENLTDRARLERDARLAIVNAYHQFTRGLQLAKASHLQVFTDRYNQRFIAVADWVREAVPSFAKRSLDRWIAESRKGRSASLAYDPAQSRKGTGVLETANGGKVRAYMLALIAHQPYLSADAVRTQCRAEFGDTINTVSKGVEKSIPMPPVRTFQHTLKVMKQRHKVELVKLTNPDLYRSTMAPSGVGMLRDVTEPNQLWQIDASPVDALCTDGRHAIYVCLDVATRREVLFVSRTPRASAVALLIRKAIQAWGVPDVVKTDNGSDFVARDTQRLFASLKVEPELSEAYTPEQKGHVERTIKTFQHQVGPLLPGFIGHSVADRKAIESRKSFAQRLGESDAETFAVSLTGPELQRHVDDWATLVHQHRKHAGLKMRTPFQVAAASMREIRTVDERALDLLLMPVAGGDGRRTVTKFGIRVAHRHYMTPTILPGVDVLVRMDPNDLGRAYAFSADGGLFLGVATCPEFSGISPQAVVKASKEIQRELLDERTRQMKADMKRIAKGQTLIERALDVARRDVPNVIPLPKRREEHTTPQIAAALEAMAEPTATALDPRAAAEHRRLVAEMDSDRHRALHESTEAVYERQIAKMEADRTAHLPKDENVVPLRETAKERYRRAVEFAQLLEQGRLGSAEALWLGRYQESAEYRSHRHMHEDFGDAYLS